MGMRIKEIYGYTLVYDERMRRFLIEDTDGTELAHANTQDEAEVKAKALTKQEFKRIRIMRVVQDGQTVMGELTSLNRDDQSAWVSMGKSEHTYGSGRQRVSLRYDHCYYELTEANCKILEALTVKAENLKHIRGEIEALIDTLEKQINLGYFGITTTY